MKNMKIMKKSTSWLAAGAMALAAFHAKAELLVYDGIPISGTGAYEVRPLFDWGATTGQNPTHVSIVGGTGQWVSSEGTGAITVEGAGTLAYPSGVNFTPIGGSLKMTHAGNTSAPNPQYRTLRRLLSTPVAEQSFFITVLMDYDDLSVYNNGMFAGWGLAKAVIPTNDNYPLSDGLSLGFRRDTSSALTGVSAVMRADGVWHVIEKDVAPGTHWFALRFQYSAAGDEIISAALLKNGAEPSLSGGGWDVTVTNEVLNSSQSFARMHIGYNYAFVNGKRILVDEWRVGTEWHDVAGEDPDTTYAANTGVAEFTIASGTVEGRATVISATDPAATVRVYYGKTDGMDNAPAWGAFHEFQTAATTANQAFSVKLENLDPGEKYYFRFAAETTTGGEKFAPWTDSFHTIENVVPQLVAGSASGVTKTAATVGGTLVLGYPETQITACIDAVDRGENSIPSDWWKKEDAGKLEFAGSFGAAFSGLLAGTEYTVRFYGTNTAGAAWSDKLVFRTAAPALNVRDAYFKKDASGKTVTEFVSATLDFESGEPVSFRYRTSQATEGNCENAVAGRHFAEEAEVVTIPPGVTRTNLPVRIIGNKRDEFPGRRFYVRFDQPDNVALPGNPAEVGILCDNMGRLVFHDDFSAGAGNWTRRDPGAMWVSGGRMYLDSRNVSGATRALAGPFKADDIAVRAMGMSEDTWREFGLTMCDNEVGGGARGYDFWHNNNTHYWAYDGRLMVGGVRVAGVAGTTMMGGARTGFSPVMRPLAMRVTRTPEGHNRVRGWAGFYKAFDYLDTSGAFTEGGYIGILGGWWCIIHWDEVEVFYQNDKTTLVIIR